MAVKCEVNFVAEKALDIRLQGRGNVLDERITGVMILYYPADKCTPTDNPSLTHTGRKVQNLAEIIRPLIGRNCSDLTQGYVLLEHAPNAKLFNSFTSN